MKKRSQVLKKVVMLPIEVEYQEDGEQIIMSMPGYHFERIVIAKESFEASYQELSAYLERQWAKHG